MALESGMVAKIAAALGLAGISSAGVYYGQDYFSSKSPLSKYDRALIDFLKGDKHDITFEVKKNGSNESDLQSSDLNLSGTATSVTVKVQVGTATKTNFKVKNGSPDATIEELKKKNNNKDWTWSCSFEFKKEENLNSHTLEDGLKNQIMGESNKGLFGILKKDLSSYVDAASPVATTWTKKQLKDVKTKFIENCAKQRTKEANEAIENSQEVGDKLTSSIPAFVFVAKAGNGANKLTPENEVTFKEWFQGEYGTNTYNTSGN